MSSDDEISGGQVVRWIIGLSVLFVILGCVLGAVVQGADFFVWSWLAPRKAAVERKVFENTKSYKEGFAQEVRDYRRDYMRAETAHDEEHRLALRSAILHMVADYDLDKLPADLHEWIDKLRNDSDRYVPMKYPTTSSQVH